MKYLTAILVAWISLGGMQFIANDALAECEPDARQILLKRFSVAQVDVLCGTTPPDYKGTPFENATALSRVCSSKIGICSIRTPIPVGAPCGCGGEASTGVTVTNAVCGGSINDNVDQTTIPSKYSPFLGIWSGRWNNKNRLCGAFILKNAQRDGSAQILYIYGEGGLPWHKQNRPGSFDSDSTLSFEDEQGSNFVFTMNKDNELVGQFTSGVGSLRAIFNRTDRK
jgi:hypothetical protein